MTIRHLFAILLTAGMQTGAFAADYLQTLHFIVDSSPAVEAAASLSGAEHAENHTGLNLANPEVEFSYQWGSPSGVPDKKTLAVSQSFDFATISGAKRRLAEAKDMVSDRNLRLAMRDVAAEADAIMTDAVYRRRLASYYESSIRLSESVLRIAEKGKANGILTVVDVNSLKIELNSLKAEADINRLEEDALMASLTRLSGGRSIQWEPTEYMAYELPADISEWSSAMTQASPEIEIARARTVEADKEVSLRKTEGLPSVSLGYTSEMVPESNYHGISVGIDIPLWGNHGRVKAAKAAKAAADIAMENTIEEYRLQHSILYGKALALRGIVSDTRRLHAECDIRALLEKQYELGEISASDYLSQMKSLLELDRKVIESEHDYQLALTAFRSSTLQ